MADGSVAEATLVDRNADVARPIGRISPGGIVGGIGDMVGSVAEGGAIVGRISEGKLIEVTLGDDSVQNERLTEPGLPDGYFRVGIVPEGRPIEDRLAGGEPFELAIAVGAFAEGNVWLRGRTVVNVAEGRTIVISVVGGKLTERMLPDGRLIDEKVAKGTLMVGKVVDGTPIKLRLTDRKPMEFELTEEREIEFALTAATPVETGLIAVRPSEPEVTEGKVTGARVVTETPTGSILMEPGFKRVVGLVATLWVCSTDTTDAVEVDGWPAGTLMGLEPPTGAVMGGAGSGLAEIRGASRKGSRVESCMIWATVGGFSFSSFLFFLLLVGKKMS